MESKYEPGAWFVEGVQWKLPYYFRLERKLGAGSFSQVIVMGSPSQRGRVGMGRADVCACGWGWGCVCVCV